MFTSEKVEGNGGIEPILELLYRYYPRRGVTLITISTNLHYRL